MGRSVGTDRSAPVPDAAGPVASARGGAAHGPRLLVPDLLRGVAITAMLVAHAIPFLPGAPGPLKFAMYQVNDVASPLFALVMGMSSQLVVQRAPRSRRAVVLGQQAVRGLLLIALGLWMATWGSWVAIVLAHLGVLLVVGPPFLLLATRWLTVAAAGIALLGAPLNAWARGDLAGWVTTHPWGITDELAAWVALDPHYRLTNLLPFFLLGSLLLRHGAVRDRLLWALAAVAVAAYCVRPVVAALVPGADVQSGTYPDTLHDLGLVLGAYTVVVLVATSPGVRTGPLGRHVLEPLAGIGSVALSLYVLHVAVLALIAPGGLRPAQDDLLAWCVVVPGMLGVGYLWWRFVGTGPVEWLMGAVTGRRRPLRRRPVTRGT